MRLTFQRIFIITALLALPSAVHGLYHLAQYANNWRTPWYLSWLDPVFGNESFVWGHVVVVATEWVVIGWLLYVAYRLLRIVYRLLGQESLPQLPPLTTWRRALFFLLAVNLLLLVLLNMRYGNDTALVDNVFLPWLVISVPMSLTAFVLHRWDGGQPA
jgi:hypothetical protein